MSAAPLRFRRLDPRAVLPTRAHPGDAGLDLHALEPVTLEPGARRRSAPGSPSRSRPGTRVSCCRARGWPRRHGISLVNAPGLIDAGYRGELEVLLLNTDRSEPVTLDAGDRIAQLVLVAVSTPEVEEADALSESARGAGGFGSSGALTPAPPAAQPAGRAARARRGTPGRRSPGSALGDRPRRSAGGSPAVVSRR